MDGSSTHPTAPTSPPGGRSLRKQASARSLRARASARSLRTKTSRLFGSSTATTEAETVPPVPPLPLTATQKQQQQQDAADGGSGKEDGGSPPSVLRWDTVLRGLTHIRVFA